MNSINFDLTCPSYDLTSEYGSDGSANSSFNQMQVPDGGIEYTAMRMCLSDWFGFLESTN